MDRLLRPYKYKWIGVALVFSGLIGLACFNLFDFQINLPVFAVCSSFLVTKICTVFRTNVADELIILSLLAGFFILIFSKEKIENDTVKRLRLKAFGRAMIANMVLLIFSTLFLYGNAYMVVLLINLFSFSVFYLIFFNLLKWKNLDRKGMLK
jgi:hypothetical protein